MNNNLFRNAALLLSLASTTFSVHADEEVKFVFFTDDASTATYRFEEENVQENQNAIRIQRMKKIALISGCTVAAIASLYVFDKYALSKIWQQDPIFSPYVDKALAAIKTKGDVFNALALESFGSMCGWTCK
jgi:hypothetical protein